MVISTLVMLELLGNPKRSALAPDRLRKQRLLLVTFRYKHELDPEGVPQFGLVAEDVEKVNPDLVARDDHGKPYTVRYEAVNAMLLNEFLKEYRRVDHQEVTIAQQDRKIQEQEATITQLEKGMKTVVARLEEQAAQIQNVSAALEARKSSPQIVLNNQ